MTATVLLQTALADIERARKHLHLDALEIDSPALGATGAAMAARWPLAGRCALPVQG